MGEVGEMSEMSEMSEASEIGPQACMGRTSMGLNFKVFQNTSLWISTIYVSQCV